MAAVAMGQGAGAGGSFVGQKSGLLVTTGADLVTITGGGRRTVKVWNLHATQGMWVLPLAKSTDTAAAASVDNAYYVPPTGQTPAIVPVTVDNAGKAYISIVGNANAYAISLG